MAGSRQGLSQVELAALLQRGDHWIPGTKGPGQTLTCQPCRHMGKCGKQAGGMSHSSQPVNIWF